MRVPQYEAGYIRRLSTIPVSMLLLSATGTLRLILVLLIVWLLLRAWMRSRQPQQGKPPGTHWGAPDQRSKGEVRIERTEPMRKAQQGPVEDADFEEIK
jgi:hypothetical protein